MKTSMLIAAPALALAVAGCGQSGPRPTLTRLDCPSAQGDLTRVSAAADGKSCVYRTPDGETINLALVAVEGDARATLDTIEASLKAPGLATAGPVQAKPTAQSGTAADAARVLAEAEADANGDSDTDMDGRAARVDLPGIHITSENDDAQVQIGSLKIDASEDQATIKVVRDVRMRGEALSPAKRGLRATFIYAGKDLPGGYSFVGYEASGPRTGPLVVATVKSKADIHASKNDEANRIYPDVKKLVRHNGGA